MSCGCNNNSSACPEVPYPQFSQESVPSLISNLVYALYGQINKSVVSGRVVWDIPCDPASNPAEVPGLPRMEGEGLLCYIMRAFVLFATEGFNINSPFLRWSFTGNGTTQSYNLPDAFGLLPNSYLVYIDGVVQDPVNFTISNTNPIAINFSTAIPNGSVVTIISLGGATPSTDVTDYTATPDGSSTSNTIGYWLAQSTFNQNSNYQVTGTPTARNLVTRGGDVINVKDFGATGNGTTDDTAAIQAAITAAPAGAAIYFPRGSYLGFRLKITKNLSIIGDGIGSTEWVWSQNTWSNIPNENDAYFQINGANTNFYLEGGTIIDKFGFRLTGNGNYTSGVANLYAGEPAYLSTLPNKIQIKNVRFVDLYDCIYGHAANLNVENCEFIYTYGMAGISSPMPNNSEPSGHPCAAIGGGFGSLIAKNNYFNGLFDESFSGANATSVNCRTAAHNFIIGGLRYWSISQWGGANKQFIHDYSNNTIINHGIEGILFAQQQDYAGVPVARMPKNVSLNITGNFIKSVQNFWLPNYYPAITPAIICSGRLPSTTISNNTIHFARNGIVVDQYAYDPTAPTNPPANPSLYGNISITNNSMLGVNVGIVAKFLSPKDIISENSIFCQAKPWKDATATIRTLNNNLPIAYNGLVGIKVETNTLTPPSGAGSENGCPFISNNELSAEYDWDLTTTITAINTATRQITFASVSGITLLPSPATSTFGFVVPYNGRAWIYSIETIIGNVVTVAQSGTLLPNFPIGTAIYWSKFITSTDAALNALNVGVEMFAFNNTIKGFLRDAATEFSSNQKYYLTNTITKDVYEKTSDYPTFWSANAQPVSEGIYTKF
jgi:hypothetical protein